ncbi:Quinone oxidoreductase 2 [Streptomyces sp. RB5]|uniref:Quinone oxidoreductase 2 n=1 Tax=Streptomyces smaragdinus TaxID=2585196 RepID=A0A7K0CG17_9ACTN|nr:SDR family oxidoreductase [Streptomyces smaragdinus]MQY11962.1 Quinone oxidoreductase 2 [Streptomyces smaragdinus]
MIVVTGATGQLGSRIVQQLLDRLPTDRFAASARTPERAKDLADRGIQVRHGDYTRPDALTTAFTGADQVLLISAGTTGPEAIAQHTHAIHAAAEAGVRRIVYTSHQAAAPASLFAPMPDHAATEQLLAESPVDFVALRNGFYAGTVPRLLGPALQTGELTAPADGPFSWTSHDDLALAAVRILLDEPELTGATAPLTGPAALDLADVAALLSHSSGRTIRRVLTEDEEWVAGLIKHGVPDDQARMLLGMFHAARHGEFDVVDPTLADLMGRPATPLETTLQAAG